VNGLVAVTRLLLSEGAEAAQGPFGIPMTVWQLANLVGFIGALLYFVARPLTNLFRQRQLEIAQRLQEAEHRRAEAARLETQIHQRLTDLEKELAEILARGVADGEAARAALIAKAEQDGQAVRRAAQEQIARKLDSAKDELRRTAAELTASTAGEIVSAEINDADRQRLLAESIRRLGEQA
jgi:F-type H+-transporting ATPase subunit b